MKTTHLAGVLAGFAGGLLGAYVVGNLGHGGAVVAPASAATPSQQDVVTASRIRLVDVGGILRLFGGHETPVVVLKNQGRDRSIYGLNASTTEPFITNFAGDGKRSDVFGKF